MNPMNPMNPMEFLARQGLITDTVKRGFVIAVAILVGLLTLAWALASLGEMQAERLRRRHLSQTPDRNLRPYERTRSRGPDR